MAARKTKSVGIGGPPEAFVKALERMLEPLVRALLGFGITFPVFARLLKPIFVRVATREARATGAAPTVSRISVMTGLQRKDIGEITEKMERRTQPELMSLGNRLSTIWLGDKTFTDSSGRSLPLSRLATARPCFEDLVRRVSTDVRPRAILDEWLRLGIVEIDADDRVHLKSDAFVPRQGFDELAYFYGRNLSDHVATSTHNLLGKDDPRLEQAVYYDKLTPASVEELARLSREFGMEALRRINREALRLADADEDKDDATQRMSVGLYFFAGPDEGKDGGRDPK